MDVFSSKLHEGYNTPSGAPGGKRNPGSVNWNGSHSSVDLHQTGDAIVPNREGDAGNPRKRKCGLDISSSPSPKKSTCDNKQKEFNCWITAATNGDIGTLKRLHKREGYDVNTANGVNGEKTALHLASGRGYAKVVTLLLEWGAEVDAQSKDGMTPLMYACEESHSEVVEILLKGGANTLLKSTMAETAFHFAVGCHHQNIIRSLATTAGGPMSINRRNQFGKTPLHCAVAGNYNKMVTTLIFYGADVNCTNNEGENALHIAAKSGFTDIGESLLQACCSETHTVHPKEGVEKQNSRECDESFIERTNPPQRRTPLELAIQFDQFDFVKLLFEKGKATCYFEVIHPDLKSKLYKNCEDLHKYYFARLLASADIPFFLKNKKESFSKKSCKRFKEIYGNLSRHSKHDVEKESKPRIGNICCSLGGSSCSGTGNPQFRNYGNGTTND